MAYQLTQRALSLSNLTEKTPQLVLEIDGFPNLLTSVTIEEVIKYGTPGIEYGDPGIVYGGVTSVSNQKTYLSLEGTTNNISQQLLQDEGGSSSTTNLTIALVNKNNELGQFIKPTSSFDLLSKQARVWLGVEGSSYPEDFIILFVGRVTQINTQPGLVKLTISHPENKKRTDIFPPHKTLLNGSIDNSQTTISVDDASLFLLPSSDGLFIPHVRINDEIITYSGVSGNDLTGCTRGALSTTANSHSDDTEVTSFYQIGDSTSDSNAFDLSLKIMLSGGNEYFLEDVSADSFNSVGGDFIQNAIFFPNVDLITIRNVQSGDFITIEGSTSNDFIDRTILSVFEVLGGSYVIVSGSSLTTELSSSGIAKFKSQYNTLPDGLAAIPEEVDIDQFLRLKSFFFNSSINYEFYFQEEIEGKDLINKEIFYPSALYALPRKGRISVGKTTPPLPDQSIQTINEASVLNASEISINRSTLENFYNTVNFKYQKSIFEERFLRGKLIVSEDSFNQIDENYKIYSIEALGVRETNDNLSVIDFNNQRIIDRYRFGAEGISSINVPFNIGWGIEIGDAVVVEGLQAIDSEDGERGLSPKFFEVTNRSFNYKTGVIKLDLLNTTFNTQGRYATISPSSRIASGSSGTRIILKDSETKPELETERSKWEDYIGYSVQIHSVDYASVYESTIVGLDPVLENALLIGDIGITPSEDWILDIADYQNAEAYLKTVHCFWDPQIGVTGGTSNFVFDVDTPARFFVGCIVLVHNYDYTNVSIEALVTDITGSTITVGTDLGYTPSNGDYVDLIGFVDDEGFPYRYY